MSVAIPISDYHSIVHQVKDDPVIKDLTHEELVADNLFQILEEKYRDLSKEELDAIIMLLIQTTYC